MLQTTQLLEIDISLFQKIDSMKDMTSLLQKIDNDELIETLMLCKGCISSNNERTLKHNLDLLLGSDDILQLINQCKIAIYKLAIKTID